METPNSNGIPEGYEAIFDPEPLRFELNKEKTHYLAVQPNTPRYLSAPFEVVICKKIEPKEDEYSFINLLVLRCTKPE